MLVILCKSTKFYHVTQLPLTRVGTGTNYKFKRYPVSLPGNTFCLLQFFVLIQEVTVGTNLTIISSVDSGYYGTY